MPSRIRWLKRSAVALAVLLVWGCVGSGLRAELKTWDGKHGIGQIEVTTVYFVARDRTPLPDWKERVAYFCKRIEQFHQREFQGQSVLKAVIPVEPFQSARTTEQLQARDADFTFYETLGEVDSKLHFGQGERKAFPILLVLSDINWQPLDDFYRLKTTDAGKLEFEGQYSGGRHFPGAASGGARASYLADRGVGWGLVSGDGWRVPYSGTDCVVYHEGVGHPIGLPHPAQGNGSVMSLGQYQGWLSESWLDDAQKKRLGWLPPDKAIDRKADLFSTFTALPEPLTPKPNEPVSLRLVWPEGAKIKSCRIRLQTDLYGPWVVLDGNLPTRSVVPEVPELGASQGSECIALGRFDRATPVSYRVDLTLVDGRDVELWGYFQVREKPDVFPLPVVANDAVRGQTPQPSKPHQQHFPTNAINLLTLVDVTKDRVSGEWEKVDEVLTSPKAYGARIELPYQTPEEYELVVIAEPLDEPNGLLLGQRLGGQRFVVLVNFAQENQPPLSAIENIDGKNVGNGTTVPRKVLTKNRASLIVCRVRKDSISVTCDGHSLIEWSGDSKRLSLSDYWSTPHNSAIFLGAYDCRYRFHRILLTPLAGQGKNLR